MSERPALRLRALALGFGEWTVVAGIDLDVPARGITVVLGPAGVGKSTLLRLLARRAELLPSFWHTGDVLLADGADLLRDLDRGDARRRVALFAQKARLHTASVLDNLLASHGAAVRTLAEKRTLATAILARAGLEDELRDRLSAAAVTLPLGLQRRLTLARIAAADPAVLLVDEPTRDVSDREAAQIEAFLAAEASRRAILLVTHDQAMARRRADRVLFLVAGAAAASGEASAFFARPPSEIARRFLSMGNCWPDDPTPTPPPVRVPAREPSGFRWILPGLLAGMARPGLLRHVDEDLASLRGLGVHTVVTLEEAAFPADRLAAHGLAGDHVPIPDMAAPGLDEAVALCRRTRARLAAGQPTVYHCKGGLGRTGCLLAAYLVFTGMDAVQAVDELRSLSPGYIQSEAQVELLHELAARVRAEGSSARG